MRIDGGLPTASVDDSRLTPLGRVLRRFKIDELPTLINLLKGDIGLVGPRPDVPSEIESLDYETKRMVLSVKPGLVSPATLWNIDEDKYLAGTKNPHEVYCREIKPIKYELNKWYVARRNWWLDTRILFAAFFRLLGLKNDLLRVQPDWLRAYEEVRKYQRKYPSTEDSE